MLLQELCRFDPRPPRGLILSEDLFHLAIVSSTSAAMHSAAAAYNLSSTTASSTNG
ncbi:unnamed protein product [Protopolystoma xenopodis]|uniref:Uncharacterized protein n=1 Tax=Protopolystoma xenopodis TaxID=117903 RepID=A0A3S5A945_9PLAT|nr:unnamed protein product [Protopolystoma xenopodis]